MSKRSRRRGTKTKESAPAPVAEPGRIAVWFRAHAVDLAWVSGLTLIAAALRLYRLDVHSLWIDETDSIYLSTHVFSNKPFSTPHYLYWALVHPFLKLSFGVFALRFLSAICGILCVPAGYALGRLWYGRWTGRMMAAVMTFSPYLLFYSREARYYSAMILLSLLSLIVLTLMLKKPRWWLVLILLILQPIGYGVHPTFLVLSAAQFGFAAVFGIIVLLRSGEGATAVARIAGNLKRAALPLALSVPILAGMLVWLFGYSNFPINKIFDLDSTRRAVDVNLDFRFFTRAFVEFAEFPRVASPAAGRWIVLASVAAGVIIGLRVRARWFSLFFAAWAIAHFALWIFPSNNVYRVKYISFLYPMIMLQAALAWGFAAEFAEKRFGGPERRWVGWATSLGLLAIAQAAFALPTVRLLGEKRSSFAGVIDQIDAAAKRLDLPYQTLLVNMPAYYGMRAYWELSGYSLNSMAYLRLLHFNMEPPEAAAMGRHYLMRPGLKWWSVVSDARDDETNYFEKRIGAGFELVAEHPPTYYDLWNYTVPLSLWKHHNSTINAPGPSLVALIDQSPVTRELGVNTGLWDRNRSSWTREVYVATAARYSLGVERLDALGRGAALIREGHFVRIDEETRRAEVRRDADGNNFADLEEGFYRAELIIGAPKDSGGFEPAMHALVAREHAGAAENDRFYRPEFFAGVRPDQQLAMRALPDGSILALFRFGSAIDYPILTLEPGAYRLKLINSTPSGQTLWAQVEASLAGQSIGFVRRMYSDEQGRAKVDYSEPIVELGQGVNVFSFRFGRPEQLPPEMNQKYTYFAGFMLEREGL